MTLDATARSWRAGLFILLVAALARPPTGGEPRWLEVRSLNFVVYSDADADTARRIGAQFEALRDVFGHISPDARLTTRRPIPVLAARNEASLKRLLPGY